jgi:hypothetical protein
MPAAPHIIRMTWQRTPAVSPPVALSHPAHAPVPNGSDPLPRSSYYRDTEVKFRLSIVTTQHRIRMLKRKQTKCPLDQALSGTRT